MDNSTLSMREVLDFLAQRPNKYFCYITKHQLSPNQLESYQWRAETWFGDSICERVAICGPEYRSNFGDKRRSVWFKAITGDYYAGTFFCSAGDYARVRKIKRPKWLGKENSQ